MGSLFEFLSYFSLALLVPTTNATTLALNPSISSLERQFRDFNRPKRSSFEIAQNTEKKCRLGCKAPVPPVDFDDFVKRALVDLRKSRSRRIGSVEKNLFFFSDALAFAFLSCPPRAASLCLCRARMLHS